MTEQDRRRMRSLLVSLFFDGGVGEARAIQRELERVHGTVATLGRVRQDLVTLDDLGLVRKENDVVALTEEGREVAQGKRQFG